VPPYVCHNATHKHDVRINQGHEYDGQFRSVIEILGARQNIWLQNSRNKMRISCLFTALYRIFEQNYSVSLLHLIRTSVLGGQSVRHEKSAQNVSETSQLQGASFTVQTLYRLNSLYLSPTPTPSSCDPSFPLFSGKKMKIYWGNALIKGNSDTFCWKHAIAKPQ
jgi:hypothetical protein